MGPVVLLISCVSLEKLAFGVSVSLPVMREGELGWLAPNSLLAQHSHLDQRLPCNHVFQPRQQEHSERLCQKPYSNQDILWL